jgi:hypothetical protein
VLQLCFGGAFFSGCDHQGAKKSVRIGLFARCWRASECDCFFQKCCLRAYSYVTSFVIFLIFPHSPFFLQFRRRSSKKTRDVVVFPGYVSGFFRVGFFWSCCLCVKMKLETGSSSSAVDRAARRTVSLMLGRREYAIVRCLRPSV